MLAKINKIPAGMFLLPMILAMVLYTIWPDMFVGLGGITAATFDKSGLNFILGALIFFSGVGIDLKGLGRLLKRQGILLIVKFILAFILSIVFYQLFGMNGYLGMTTVAFVVVMSSINPAVYLSIVEDFGTEEDVGAYGLTGLFSIPMVPTIIFGVLESGGFAGMNWTPIISTLLPLALGLIVGNIDRNFAKLFTPGIGALIPLLGWNIGWGTNLIEALQSGLPGILITIIFYIFMVIIPFTDIKILKNDGIASLAMVNVAGLSVSTPTVLASIYPALEPYAAAATGQVLAACVITSLLSPVIVGARYRKVYGEEAYANRNKK